MTYFLSDYNRDFRQKMAQKNFANLSLRFFEKTAIESVKKKDIFDFLKVQSIFLRFLLAFRDQKEVHFYATFEPFFSMDVQTRFSRKRWRICGITFTIDASRN